MNHVSVRDLRKHGGRVLMANGESLTVTMDGEPVAEFAPAAIGRRAGR